MKQSTGSAASEGRHRGGIAKAHDLHFGVDYWPAETILSHPDFPEARRVYLDRVLALYGDDIFLNKLLMEAARSEEHTSELLSLMRSSYAVFCLKKKKITKPTPLPTSTYNTQR